MRQFKQLLNRGLAAHFTSPLMSGFGTMASCAAGELCAKWIAGDMMPTYATNFSFKRYDNLQLMQKLRAANKGIL